VRRTIRKEVLASLLFVAVGGTFAVASLNHPIGTAASMGRGFFPLCVGAILLMLGVLMLIRSLVVPDRKETPLSVDLRPLAAIVASIVAFAVLLPWAGLYAATIATVLVASRAEAGFNLLPAAILGFGLAVAGHLSFVVGIGLTLPLWPSILQP